MNKVFTDIAEVFKRNKSQATQLVVLNLVVFFSLTLIRFGFRLFAGKTGWAAIFDQNTLVSGRWMEFITHPWTILFFPFTQAGLLSLLFNLILIYWFGNMIADFIGGRKMLVTYVVGSLFSILFFMSTWGIFTLLNKDLAYVGQLYGASPGAFALMYAYVALNPESEMMPFGIRMKTRILALIFLVLSIFLSPALGVLDLGGALFGYIHMKLLKSGLNITYVFEKFNWPKLERKSKSTNSSTSPLKIIKPTKPVYPPKDGMPSQEEIDFLLDKINKGGYGSLTNEEKNRLYKASQSAD